MRLALQTELLHQKKMAAEPLLHQELELQPVSLLRLLGSVSALSAAAAAAWQSRSSTTRVIHVCASDLLRRKPRINSQLVAQQVAQQYPMPPPPKKERRERSERTDKERPDGEGEHANVEGRPEVERPERVRPEGDTPEKDKSDKEQPIKDKHDTEKDISPAVTKKPGSKKTRSEFVSSISPCLPVLSLQLFDLTGVFLFPPDPSRTTIRAPPATNTAYSLASRQARQTRTLTSPGAYRRLTLKVSRVTTLHFLFENTKPAQRGASGKPMIHS